MKRSTFRGGRILRERHEHLRERFALQSLPPHVADHAHHGVPRAVGIPRAQLEPSAYRVLPRPRAPSQRVVDDRDPRSLGPIRDRKEAAAEQRRSERSEEIRADFVSCKQQALGNRSGVPFDSQGLFPGVTGEQIVDDAGALDTRHRLNLFEHAVVQVGPLRGDTEGRRGCDFHHQDPLRPESRINVVHVPPASDEQTGADEQNDRQRKLRHNEGAADSTAGCSARDTSATLLAGRTQIAAHRRNRRRQSHQDSRQKRHGQGQAEDAEIEAHFVQTRQVARAEGTDEVECLPRRAVCRSGPRRRQARRFR